MSLEEHQRPTPVILSDDHIVRRNTVVSRRNLGCWVVVGQVASSGEDAV